MTKIQKIMLFLCMVYLAVSATTNLALIMNAVMLLEGGIILYLIETK